MNELAFDIDLNDLDIDIDLGSKKENTKFKTRYMKPKKSVFTKNSRKIFFQLLILPLNT